MSNSQDDARSRNHWAIISLARAVSVSLVVLALLMLNGTVGGSSTLGYLLLAAGLAGTFALPQILARTWRSPPE